MRAAEFLTPVQLMLLQQLHQEQRERAQQWIEQARLRACLDPNIPERSATPLLRQLNDEVRSSFADNVTGAALLARHARPGDVPRRSSRMMAWR